MIGVINNVIPATIDSGGSIYQYAYSVVYNPATGKYYQLHFNTTYSGYNRIVGDTYKSGTTWYEITALPTNYRQFTATYTERPNWYSPI